MDRTEKVARYQQLLGEKAATHEVDLARDLFAEFERGHVWGKRLLDGALRHLEIAPVRGVSLTALPLEHGGVHFLEPIRAVYDGRLRHRDPASWGVRLDNIAYMSGAVRMRGVAARPLAPGPHPLVIWNHGGGWGVTQTYRAVMCALAERGYVVLALNFRAGIIGPDGMPWFGTSDGLLRWNGRGLDQELQGITIFPPLVATDGSVWAGTAEDGLMRWVGTSVCVVRLINERPDL